MKKSKDTTLVIIMTLVVILLLVLMFQLQKISDIKKTLYDIEIQKLKQSIDSINKVNKILIIENDSLKLLKQKTIEKIKIIKEKTKDEKNNVEKLNDTMSVNYFNDYINNYRTDKKTNVR